MLMSMAFWHLLSDSLSWHSAMATVGASVGASTSVGASVGATVGAAVGASVCAAVGAVVTDETASHQMKCVKLECWYPLSSMTEPTTFLGSWTSTIGSISKRWGIVAHHVTFAVPTLI